MTITRPDTGPAALELRLNAHLPIVPPSPKTPERGVLLAVEDWVANDLTTLRYVTVCGGRPTTYHIPTDCLTQDVYDALWNLLEEIEAAARRRPHLL